MQLTTVGGKLTLRSVFKLFVWGWLLSWGALCGVIFLLLVLATIVTGQVTVNGELVQGRGPALMAMLRILPLFPVVIIFHAFFFGGFCTLGVWLYRLRRPLNVVAKESASQSGSV